MKLRLPIRIVHVAPPMALLSLAMPTKDSIARRRAAARARGPGLASSVTLAFTSVGAGHCLLEQRVKAMRNHRHIFGAGSWVVAQLLASNLARKAVHLAVLSASLGLMACAATGCGMAVATYPNCPLPVLISRVNRVGVKQPMPGRSTGTEDILRATSGVHVSAASETVANTTYTQAQSQSSGPFAFTGEALSLSPNKADADVTDLAIDGLHIGTFFFFAIAGLDNEVWAEPKGRKVWIK